MTYIFIDKFEISNKELSQMLKVKPSEFSQYKNDRKEIPQEVSDQLRELARKKGIEQ